jgi:signal transduction histidine kinase
MNDVAGVLREVFPGLEGDGLERLVGVARERAYSPQTVVVREEDAGDTFFVILQGQVEVTKQIDSQTERVLQRYGPGEFFGEIALIEPSPRSATVRTLTASTLLAIDKDDFETVLAQYSAMALTVMRKLAQRLRRADQTAIAELRQKNEELARANWELMEQERLRSEFLTAVAHELRTPLTTASGYVTLVAGGKMGAEQVQQAINRAERNVKRVVKLVNDILFMQEMELILPEFRAVSLPELVSKVAVGRRQQAVGNDVSLRVNVEEDLPQVMGDSEWLRRAIDAMLDNAIKFSPNGGEVVTHVTYQSGQVQLAISDQGVGIPADQMDRVFTRFERVQRDGQHLFDGVGLGLPVARQIVEQHGGTMEVQSVEGEGSTFVMRLPVVG